MGATECAGNSRLGGQSQVGEVHVDGKRGLCDSDNGEANMAQLSLRSRVVGTQGLS